MILGGHVMSLGVRTVFAMLMFTAAGTTVASSRILSQIEDRDRPDFRPEISSKVLLVPGEPVPLPRLRPKISTAIPLPRPAPANVSAAPTPVTPEVDTPEATTSSPTVALPRPVEPTTVTSPKAGDVFMPIPTISMPPARPEPESD